MKNSKFKYLALSAILLITMGVFAVPATSRADFDINTILTQTGLGSLGQYFPPGYYPPSGATDQYYDDYYTRGDHSGDLKLSKEVLEVGEDSDYHDKIEVRSGALVEVWIEVENTSKNAIEVIVRDQLVGSVVYVQNSLTVNGQSSAPGLTSGGLNLKLAPKAKTNIKYRMNVCDTYGSTMRADAYSAGVGSATDAIVITTEHLDNAYSYGYTSACLNQVTNANTTTATYIPTTYGTTSTSPTASANYALATTPAEIVTVGVNNPYSNYPVYYPVNNGGVSYSDSFGYWYGVDNTHTADTYYAQPNQPNYYSYPSYNYPANTPPQQPAQTYAPMQPSQTTYYPPTSPNTAYAGSTPYYVAPTTGADKKSKYAPLFFAGGLVGLFVIYRYRKQIFN